MNHQRIRLQLYEILQSKYFITMVLTFAVVLRLCWLYLVPAQPLSDFKWYYDRAVSISMGNGYSVEGRPTANFPVGYSAFLALFFTVLGPSVALAKVLNLLLAVGVLLMSYRLMARLFASDTIGRIALAILAFYPNHIAYTSLLACEMLFLFLLLLGTLFICTKRPSVWLSIATGVVFALDSLIRPPAIFIPAVVAAVYLLSSREKSQRMLRLRQLIVISVTMMVVIAPWNLRNYYVFHRFVPISNNGGVNLYIGNGPYAMGAWIYTPEMMARLGDVSNEYERDRRGREYAIQYMSAHPMHVIKLLPKKFLYMYGRDMEGVQWNERGIYGKNSLATASEGSVSVGIPKRILRILALVSQAFYMLVGIAFIGGLSLVHSRRGSMSANTLSMLGFWIIVYFTMFYMVFFGDSRFHFPVIPWIVGYAALFLNHHLASVAEEKMDSELSAITV